MTKPELARLFEGKKFLWDGVEYESDEEASATEKSYREDGFEVVRVTEGARSFLYTRRAASSAEAS